jgi:RND superfamily putative drug exporter
MGLAVDDRGIEGHNEPGGGAAPTPGLTPAAGRIRRSAPVIGRRDSEIVMRMPTDPRNPRHDRPFQAGAPHGDVPYGDVSFDYDLVSPGGRFGPDGYSYGPAGRRAEGYPGAGSDPGSGPGPARGPRRSSRPERAGITTRVARWSVRHRRAAIAAWVLGVVLAVAVGAMAGTKSLTDSDDSTGEDGRAQQTLADHHFQAPSVESVLIRQAHPGAAPPASSTAGGPAADPAVRSTVADVVAAVTATGKVTTVRVPVATPGASLDPGLVSKDGRSVLVTFDMLGDPDTAGDRVQPVLDAVAKAGAGHRGMTVAEFGAASADQAFNSRAGHDLDRAGLYSIPVTLGILLIVFGAVVAALLPLVLALTAFAAALGLVGLASHFVVGMGEPTTPVMLLVGLAVGVDYALFYIRREREERAQGASAPDALDIAARTSGHTIGVSALTVAVSMAGLALTGLATFTSIAVGTVCVVLVAMLGSLTVLPATLAWLGDRIDRLRLPGRGRRAARLARSVGSTSVGSTSVGSTSVGSTSVDSTSGAASPFARRGPLDAVLRRPRAVIWVFGGLLIALALPAFTLKTAQQGISDFPKDLPIVQTFHEVDAAFPGGQQPAQIVVSAPDVTTGATAKAIAGIAPRALATGEMFGPVTVDVSPDHQVAVVSVPMAGNGLDHTSTHALSTLRHHVLPAALAGVKHDGVHADVTGMTAGSTDFNHRLGGRTPLVIGFVLVLAFGLLWSAFRAPVVAGVAVGLNVLSVGAAYGLLTLVFQHHWFDGLLGFTSTGTIVNWLPLMLFVILFGLSMDYQVLVLSRIREEVATGAPVADAVRAGLRRSAPVVTSAAAIMVAVFAVFATMSQVSFKQLGVGLSASILIDATVIRVLLLPAILIRLGERAWGRRGPGAGVGPAVTPRRPDGVPAATRW